MIASIRSHLQIRVILSPNLEKEGQPRLLEVITVVDLTAQNTILPTPLLLETISDQSQEANESHKVLVN